METWRPIPGYELMYEASDHGRIRSMDRAERSRKLKGRLLKQQTFRSGHLTVALSRNSRIVTFQVHRLVLEAFVGPCPPGMECRHLNGDPSDNRLSNLCWGTRVENMDDRDRHGQRPRGDTHHNRKLAASDVLAIRSVSGSSGKVAAQYGVNPGTVRKIRLGERWAHL